VLTFREYLLIEGAGYPVWVRGSALLLTAKLRSLTSEIKSSTDPLKKLDLIAQQNNLLGYMGTLGIAVDVSDRNILQTR
jgi:hypothetical protein